MKTADISGNLEKVDLEITSILHPPAPFLSGISRQVPRAGGKKGAESLSLYSGVSWALLPALWRAPPQRLRLFTLLP